MASGNRCPLYAWALVVQLVILTHAETRSPPEKCLVSDNQPKQGLEGVSLLQYGSRSSTMSLAAPGDGNNVDSADKKTDSKEAKKEDKNVKAKEVKGTPASSGNASATTGDMTTNLTNATNATNATNGTGSADSAATTCATKADPRTRAWFAVTSPEGTPCVFGVEGDARDEGSHCIYDNGLFGSNGWCYTSKDRSSWGSCNHLCPLYGSAATLGNKIAKVAAVVSDLTKILDGSPPGPAPAGEAAAASAVDKAVKEVKEAVDKSDAKQAAEKKAKGKKTTKL